LAQKLRKILGDSPFRPCLRLRRPSRSYPVAAMPPGFPLHCRRHISSNCPRA
jgi:hypothetical protein